MSNKDFPTLGAITSNPTVAKNSIGKFEAGSASSSLAGGCVFKPGYRGIAMSFQDSTGTFKDPRVDGDPYPYNQLQLALPGRPAAARGGLRPLAAGEPAADRRDRRLGRRRRVLHRRCAQQEGRHGQGGGRVHGHRQPRPLQLRAPDRHGAAVGPGRAGAHRSAYDRPAGSLEGVGRRLDVRHRHRAVQEGGDEPELDAGLRRGRHAVELGPEQDRCRRPQDGAREQGPAIGRLDAGRQCADLQEHHQRASSRSPTTSRSRPGPGPRRITASASSSARSSRRRSAGRSACRSSPRAESRSPSASTPRRTGPTAASPRPTPRSPTGSPSRSTPGRTA